MPNQADFYNRALGESYKVPPAEKLLDELAKEYDDRCEAYDLTVCTGEMRDGRIMPMPGTKESSLINKHAREVKADMFRRHPGLTEQELHKAIRRHHAEPRA